MCDHGGKWRTGRGQEVDLLLYKWDHAASQLEIAEAGYEASGRTTRPSLKQGGCCCFGGQQVPPLQACRLSSLGSHGSDALCLTRTGAGVHDLEGQACHKDETAVFGAGPVTWTDVFILRALNESLSSFQFTCNAICQGSRLHRWTQSTTGRG